MTDDDQRRHDFKNHLGIILGFSKILRAEAAAKRVATAALDLLARLYPAQADTPR